jgi:hypothetical protein
MPEPESTRMKLRGIALVLACNTAACEEREPAKAAPGEPTPAPSVARQPPPVDAPVRADAAVPVDAPPAPRPAKSLLSGQVPDFGCLGWSEARQLAACVVGGRGSNMGSSKVSLVFVSLSGSLGGAAAPPPLVLLEIEEEHRGPDELPPRLAQRLEASLDGFVALDRDGPRIEGFDDDGRVTGAPLEAGGMTIEVKSEPLPPVAIAPQRRIVLTVRGPDGKRHFLDDPTGPIHKLYVRAFPLRDRAGKSVVLVELDYHAGDEGTLGGRGAVWRCTAKGCAAP